MDTTKERLQLHFTYCVILLLFFLILVATDRWTERQNFTDYLTNAATMVSLVLGLVAIFYSIVANTDLSKNLGGISSVANEIKATKNEVTDLLQESKKLNASGNDAAQRMTAVSTEVTTTVTSLQQTLAGVVEQTSALHAAVIGLPSRFDRLESSIEEVKVKKSTEQNLGSSVGAATTWTDSDIERLVGRPPLSTNMLMLACSLASKSGKDLSTDELAELIEKNVPNILFGSFTALHAAGLFDRKIVKNKIYKISNFNEKLAARIEPYIAQYIDEQMRDEPTEQEHWRKAMTRIKEKFTASA